MAARACIPLKWDASPFTRTPSFSCTYWILLGSPSISRHSSYSLQEHLLNVFSSNPPLAFPPLLPFHQLLKRRLTRLISDFIWRLILSSSDRNLRTLSIRVQLVRFKSHLSGFLPKMARLVFTLIYFPLSRHSLLESKRFSSVNVVDSDVTLFFTQCFFQASLPNVLTLLAFSFVL